MESILMTAVKNTLLTVSVSMYVVEAAAKLEVNHDPSIPS
jgi:hypothetical protein